MNNWNQPATAREVVTMYLALDLDVLYDHLLEAVPTRTAPPTRKILVLRRRKPRNREQGRHLFEDFILPELKGYFCREGSLCQQLEEGVLTEPYDLVLALADGIAASRLVWPFPALLVAVMLVKADPRRLCACP